MGKRKYWSNFSAGLVILIGGLIVFMCASQSGCTWGDTNNTITGSEGASMDVNDQENTYGENNNGGDCCDDAANLDPVCWSSVESKTRLSGEELEACINGERDCVCLDPTIGGSR